MKKINCPFTAAEMGHLVPAINDLFAKEDYTVNWDEWVLDETLNPLVSQWWDNLPVETQYGHVLDFKNHLDQEVKSWCILLAKMEEP